MNYFRPVTVLPASVQYIAVRLQLLSAPPSCSRPIRRLAMAIWISKFLGPVILALSIPMT